MGLKRDMKRAAMRDQAAYGITLVKAASDTAIDSYRKTVSSLEASNDELRAKLAEWDLASTATGAELQAKDDAIAALKAAFVDFAIDVGRIRTEEREQLLADTAGFAKFTTQLALRAGSPPTPANATKPPTVASPPAPPPTTVPGV